MRKPSLVTQYKKLKNELQFIDKLVWLKYNFTKHELDAQTIQHIDNLIYKIEEIENKIFTKDTEDFFLNF